MTITISLLSRGPCIYRPIQRKYGEYDHKLLDRLGSGEIARTICSCAYHKRGGSSYVIGVAFAPNHASRSHLSFPPYRLSFLGQFAFQLINTSLSVLSLSFPLSLSWRETTAAIESPRRIVSLFLSRSLSSLPLPSSPLLFFSLLFLRSSFYSLSVQHAASWNSGRRSSARHRITGHSRFRALEPKHARVVRLSWTSPRCNRGESVDQGKAFLPLRNRVCKTLFLDEFKRNGTSRKLRR